MKALKTTWEDVQKYFLEAEIPLGEMFNRRWMSIIISQQMWQRGIDIPERVIMGMITTIIASSPWGVNRILERIPSPPTRYHQLLAMQTGTDPGWPLSNHWIKFHYLNMAKFQRYIHGQLLEETELLPYEDYEEGVKRHFIHAGMVHGVIAMAGIGIVGYLVYQRLSK